MKWKEVIGWTCILNAFVSIVFIIYFNMNFGWFYDYKDSSMLIPGVLVAIGSILLVLSIEVEETENTWKWLGDEFEY